MCVAALAVMAGHAYPVFLRFKGGKAVASFIGAFLCLTPVALGAVLVVFVVVVAGPATSRWGRWSVRRPFLWRCG
ncbi:MAG: glycerol-3-phosphate acyltransferase [Ignavibacteriota bacterium]